MAPGATCVNCVLQVTIAFTSAAFACVSGRDGNLCAAWAYLGVSGCCRSSRWRCKSHARYVFTHICADPLCLSFSVPILFVEASFILGLEGHLSCIRATGRALWGICARFLCTGMHEVLPSFLRCQSSPSRSLSCLPESTGHPGFFHPPGTLTQSLPSILLLYRLHVTRYAESRASGPAYVRTKGCGASPLSDAQWASSSFTGADGTGARVHTREWTALSSWARPAHVELKAALSRKWDYSDACGVQPI